MARTVRDMAALLDVMVGYDPEDPATARGVGHVPGSYTEFLNETGLQGARIGILREPMGYKSEPDTDDFAQVSEVFDKAVADLRAAGADVVDPVAIPKLRELLETRAARPGSADEAFKEYFFRSARRPFESREEAIASADFAKVHHNARNRWQAPADETRHYRYLLAREELMTNVLRVMADNDLDTIVHKSVEHQPTLISDGIQPPFVNMRGVPHLNTFLVFVSSVTVPAGFTRDNLPAGITFFGRPYDDGKMIRYAHAYEQATRHRRPPTLTPPL
jgi:Asp-tRNA(Asn)/Glu-tRNA(Gln) amidotransferase A subunit family amidase